MAIFVCEAVEIRSFGGAPSSLSLSEDKIISAVVAAAVTFDWTAVVASVHDGGVARAGEGRPLLDGSIPVPVPFKAQGYIHV